MNRFTVQLSDMSPVNDCEGEGSTVTPGGHVSVIDTTPDELFGTQSFVTV